MEHGKAEDLALTAGHQQTQNSNPGNLASTLRFQNTLRTYDRFCQDPTAAKCQNQDADFRHRAGSPGSSRLQRREQALPISFHRCHFQTGHPYSLLLQGPVRGSQGPGAPARVSHRQAPFPAHTPPARRPPSQGPGLSSPPRAAEGRLPEAGRREGGGGRRLPGPLLWGCTAASGTAGVPVDPPPWLRAGRFRRLPARGVAATFSAPPAAPRPRSLCARGLRVGRLALVTRGETGRRAAGAQCTPRHTMVRGQGDTSASTGGWTEASSRGDESFIRTKPT
ncbi:transcription initiation factor TFIID subunit 4-like [Moschus berezovskii]|uniref:transcription initiation factor TFIID subunit 4-like n=1 Tax=Moschus berezovskii TaxID=68408 RepID=UPI002443C070|nr:transcription initiation factor TFIID subunit 4-like [Moschus berezovskii]